MSETPERYEGPGPNSDAFDPKQHHWDGIQWWTADNSHWWDGTRWLARGETPEHAAPAPAAPRKPRPPGYWRDFWLGFAGVVAVDVILFIVIVSTTPPTGNPNAVASLAPWVLNIGALILFAIIRPRVAIGMLAAYGVAFGLVLLGGCLLAVICFGGAAHLP
ncbi:MAG TPA: hypothetical protein VFL27_06760 [Candidatus Dormibacteraeota bacterium]|nr:hypothetical protein [Candidatus Dormibacteraeota bacterium]